MILQHLEVIPQEPGDEDTTITGTLTATDDIDGLSNANFTVSADGVNGGASIDAVTGAWMVYTKGRNFHGTDTFTEQ